MLHTSAASQRVLNVPPVLKRANNPQLSSWVPPALKTPPPPHLFFFFFFFPPDLFDEADDSCHAVDMHADAYVHACVGAACCVDQKGTI